MSEFLRPLPWQHELWLELTALTLQGRLGHALLFAGPAGVGKRRFARAFAAFLLCEKRSGYACGTCRSCQQLAIGAQPNASCVGLDGHLGLALGADGRHAQALQHWEPKKESKRRDVSIDAARSLMARLSLTSHYGQAKLGIIDPADELSTSAADALLKTFEEPTPDTHLILISERAQALLPTLRSRCQRIRFAPPPEDAALQWLRDQGVADAAEALAEARGAPLLAAEWSGAGVLAQRREWAADWRAVAQRKRDPIGVAATVGRDELPQLLDWLLRWLAAQLREALAGAAGSFPAAGLSRMIEAATAAREVLENNAHPQLLLESLLIQWARLTRAQIS